MGGTYGEPTETADMAPGTVEVERESGLPAPNIEGPTTVVLESLAGAGVSGIGALFGFTEVSSSSRSPIRAEEEEKKLVGLLERRRSVLWLSNAIL